jgi:hypothetical protein
MGDIPFIIPCGLYKDKTIEELQTINPQYLLWLSGTTTIVSLKTDPKGETYAKLCNEYPELIVAAKEWTKDKCHRCWTSLHCESHNEKKHFCTQMKHKDYYHFHPYGKRR